jgi:glyoxylase-like metal-dependent hydrolase (beta-lactamase superfamily II)
MVGLMWLDVFDRNPYGTNCWLLGTGGGEDALIVDPGFDAPAVRALVAEAGRKPSAILLTHAHVDHAAVAGQVGSDIPVYVHGADALAFTDELAWRAGFPNPLAPVSELRSIADGDVLTIAGLSIEVLHTPGHTPGHCCFLVDDEALVCSGDLVFAGSIGRSDFPNGDPAAMSDSLRRFLTLPDEFRVLTGHGRETTVGRERATNPFLRDLVVSGAAGTRSDP